MKGIKILIKNFNYRKTLWKVCDDLKVIRMLHTITPRFNFIYQWYSQADNKHWKLTK